MVAPLERRFQPGAAIELGVRAAKRVPPIGCADEVTKHPLAGDVVVEPRPEAGPRSGQRLVGDLEGVALGGDQPGTHEETDDPITTRVAEDRAARHPAADRVTVEGGGDEPQQDRPQRVALVGGKAVIETVGRAGDGHADPSAAFVALDGERRSVASPPCFRQGVRQQGQGAGLAFTVTHEQVDETGLQTKPRRTCRLLDGVAQAIPAERADEVQSALDEFAEFAIDAESTEVVTADDDDDGNMSDAPDPPTPRRRRAARQGIP